MDGEKAETKNIPILRPNFLHVFRSDEPVVRIENSPRGKNSQDGDKDDHPVKESKNSQGEGGRRRIEKRVPSLYHFFHRYPPCTSYVKRVSSVHRSAAVSPPTYPVGLGGGQVANDFTHLICSTGLFGC